MANCTFPIRKAHSKNHCNGVTHTQKSLNLLPQLGRGHNTLTRAREYSFTPRTSSLPEQQQLSNNRPLSSQDNSRIHSTSSGVLHRALIRMHVSLPPSPRSHLARFVNPIPLAADLPCRRIPNRHPPFLYRLWSPDPFRIDPPPCPWLVLWLCRRCRPPIVRRGTIQPTCRTSPITRGL